MRTTNFEFNGEVYPLCMNGAALFDIYENFGNDRDLTKLISKPNRKSFGNLCWILAKLSEQGSAVKRYMQEDAPKPLKEMELVLLMRPVEIVDAKQAVVNAFNLGFRRDVEETGEVDLGLRELEKKTIKTRLLHALNISKWR